MKDKIIQVTTGGYDNKTLYGVSESGNLYAIECADEGNNKWKLRTSSPELEEGGNDQK